MTETETRKPTKSVLHWVLLAILGTAAVVASISYYSWVVLPVKASQASSETTAAFIVGLNSGRRIHRLGIDFTDEDGDLIADTPKDPSKCIDPDTLVFSYIGEDQNDQTPAEFKSLTDRLAEATGKKVTFDLDVSSADEQLRALHDGTIHVTVFSTGAVPAAVNEAGFVPVGMLSGPTGNNKYKMQIIVPASGPINNVNDLKDHELALTEPSSNAGYKAPIVLLRNECGLVFERDYCTRNTNGYEKSIKGIAAGEYEAAAVASDVLERYVAEGTIKKTDYRVIYTSAEFPRAAIGYVYNLKPELAAKIKDALLSFTFKGTSLEANYAQYNIDRFAPLDYRNDWELVRIIDDTMTGPQETH
jgi:phosphonate transport system substrate-binding protein